MRALLHQLRGHHLRVIYRISDQGSGWRYTCECGREWVW